MVSWQVVRNPAPCWEKGCYAFPWLFWIVLSIAHDSESGWSLPWMSWKASSATLRAWATEIALMTFPRRMKRNPMKASSMTVCTWATEIALMTFLRRKNRNPMKASSATLHAWATEIALMTFLRRKNRNPMKASSVTVRAWGGRIEIPWKLVQWLCMPEPLR